MGSGRTRKTALWATSAVGHRQDNDRMNAREWPLRPIATLIAFLTIIGPIGLAGCGDDGGTPGTATTTPTGPAPSATTGEATATATPAEGTINVTLHFPKPTATDFEFPAVVRAIPDSQDNPRDVVQVLLGGPTAEEAAEHGVINPFPANVEVLSLDVVDGKATADFSKELLDYGGGSANVIAISGSIERTIEALTGATEVVILVDGEPDALQP